MTKRIAIAELEGVALDWVVAKAAYPESVLSGDRLGVKAGIDGDLCTIESVWLGRPRNFSQTFAPSSRWHQCGPLIERYITALNQSGYGWWAHSGNHLGKASSPLIAACRAIVAAHNPSGFVEVPDELVTTQ